jgi:hypothetical protein
MPNPESALHLSLVAAYPDRKDVVKAARTLEERGYRVRRCSTGEDYLYSEVELVVIYAPSLLGVQINKIKAAADARQIPCAEIRQESSAWRLPPPRKEVVVQPDPDPPPISAAKVPSVLPDNLPVFLQQVQKSLEADLDWGEIVGTIQPWWTGETPTGERLRQYIERLTSTPEKVPAAFREFWARYKKTPEPAVSEEAVPVETLTPPLSDMELHLLYEEAETTNQDLQAANTRLAKLQEELAAQLRQEQAATAAARQKAADYYRGLLAVRREADQLRQQVQILQRNTEGVADTLQAVQTERDALQRCVLALQEETQYLRKTPPAAEPSHRILTKEGFGAAYAAYQMKVVLAEDLVSRIAKELGL